MCAFLESEVEIRRQYQKKLRAERNEAIKRGGSSKPSYKNISEGLDYPSPTENPDVSIILKYQTLGRLKSVCYEAHQDHDEQFTYDSLVNYLLDRFK